MNTESTKIAPSGEGDSMQSAPGTSNNTLDQESGWIKLEMPKVPETQFANAHRGCRTRIRRDSLSGYMPAMVD